MTRSSPLRLPVAVLVLAAAACGAGEPAAPPPPVHPMIVVGIDGGEWTVIERLWAEGELPALRALAERGTRAVLATDYGASPVIWTTIATGRRPREHGITGFVVPTPTGDVPVSSDVRRVPALWNMATAAGRRAAVLGWWASWPAEEIEGVVVTDRVLQEPERRTWPPALAGRVDAAPPPGPESGPESAWDLDELAQRRDSVIARLGRELAPERFDLMLVYFRGVDIESHNHWRHFEPEKFPAPDPALSAAERARLADRIPRVYRATDRAIGEIVAAAPPDANVLVVSDHGFRPIGAEQVQLLFDLDAVLERLGWLVRAPGGGVEMAATRVYGHASPPHRRDKLVRFALAGREPGGRVLPRERDEVRRRLARDLARVRWEGGRPVFSLRDATPRERREGGDFVVIVHRHGASRRVLIDGRPFAGAVIHLGSISGIHHKGTAGILIAAGPDVLPGADLDGISIHDLAPTVLYGIGLPPAEDFAGRAWTELYTEEFRRGRPLTEIATWGTRDPGEPARSTADEELLEELGALGYLD